MNLACSERTVRQAAISHVAREQVCVCVGGKPRNKGNALFQLFERQETPRQQKLNLPKQHRGPQGELHRKGKDFKCSS